MPKKLKPSACKQPNVMIVVKRDTPHRWTKQDSLSLRAFLESDTGMKLKAFHEDHMIQLLLNGGDKAFITGMRYSWQYSQKFLGDNNIQSRELAASEDEATERSNLVPIQFTG